MKRGSGVSTPVASGHSAASALSARIPGGWRSAHADVGDTVHDEAVFPACTDPVHNEGYGWEETAGENPFPDEVDFFLVCTGINQTYQWRGKLTDTFRSGTRGW
jgi:hypothetical protein